MTKSRLSLQELASRVAQGFFKVGTDEASRQHAIRQLLLGSVVCAVLIPLLFYWRFRAIDGFSWGTTVFFVVYCLLTAIALYFQPRTEYHTPVKLHGDWADRVGSLWLVCCVFGPFLGWIITSAIPITLDSWRWLYASRVFLAAGLPLITAIPLTRYLRGKGTWIALIILVIVTLLPIWSAVDVGRDLWTGPIVRQVQTTDHSELYLQYTDQSLGAIK